MPDLTAQANELKQAPDPALQQELQHPSGAVAPYLVMAEAQRRQLTRQAAQAQQSQGQSGSVYDDIVRSMMARQPPQNLPAAPAGMVPMGNATQGAPASSPQNFQAPPPRMMADGGLYDDEEDDDEFSSADPFLQAGSDPFLPSPQAQGIAAIGAPQGMQSAEASPDEFMQALGGAGDVTEASPEEFLKALSLASLKGGGHGGRKGGHGGKRGGKGKGAAGDDSGGGKGGFKISKVLGALGKMGGASHGIAAHPATIHQPHFSYLHPARQPHVQGFHFAEGGHFARGGISGIVDGTQVNPDGSTTYSWHDAKGNHRTTMPPGFNVGSTTKPGRGSTKSGSSRGGWHLIGHHMPNPNDPNDKNLYTVHKNFDTGEYDLEKEGAQGASSGRGFPRGGQDTTWKVIQGEVSRGNKVFEWGGDPTKPITPDDFDKLKDTYGDGVHYWVDPVNRTMIIAPKSFATRTTEGPTFNPNTNQWEWGPQRSTVTTLGGGAPAPGAAPAPGGAPAAPGATPGVAPGPAVGGAAPAPAAGGMPPELRPPLQQPSLSPQAAAILKRDRKNAGIPREAAVTMFGDPDAPNSPGLIGLAAFAADPNIVKEVGRALIFTDDFMQKAIGNTQMDFSIGPLHIGAGALGQYYANRYHVPADIANAFQEQLNSVLKDMSPIARRIFDQTIAARDTFMGMRTLYGGTASDSSVAATIRQVPAMGETAFTPYQMYDGLRNPAGEIKNNVQNVQGIVPHNMEELMWNSPGIVENHLTGASITRPQIRAMLRKFGQPDDEAHVNALAKRAIINYGYTVPDEDPNKPETKAEVPLREPKAGMSEFYPDSVEPHLADWFRTNAASSATGVPKQIGEPGWKPESDLPTMPTPPQSQQTPQGQQPQSQQTPQVGASAQTSPGGKPSGSLFQGANTPIEQAQRTVDLMTPAWSIGKEIYRKGHDLLFPDVNAGLFGMHPSNPANANWPWGIGWPPKKAAPSQAPTPAPQLPQVQAPAPRPQIPQAPAAVPPAPAVAAPVPAPQPRPQADDEEEILRRAQEIQERRRRAAEEERQRAQPAAPPPAPAPQQAAPSSHEGWDTGPLPWGGERPQQEARGGRIFDRAPTRGETLSALTRRP